MGHSRSVYRGVSQKEAVKEKSFLKEVKKASGENRTHDLFAYQVKIIVIYLMLRSKKEVLFLQAHQLQYLARFLLFS